MNATVVAIARPQGSPARSAQPSVATSRNAAARKARPRISAIYPGATADVRADLRQRPNVQGHAVARGVDVRLPAAAKRVDQDDERAGGWDTNHWSGLRSSLARQRICLGRHAPKSHDSPEQDPGHSERDEEQRSSVLRVEPVGHETGCRQQKPGRADPTRGQ